MSATNRNPDVRDENDDYPTPSYCVDRFIEACPLPGGLWLEPSAGAGSIIRAASEYDIDAKWQAVELQEKYRHDLWKSGASYVEIGDFFTSEARKRKYAVMMGNPPYSLAWEFAKVGLEIAAYTALLLRVGFLASVKRNAWMKENRPAIYIIPNRPSFKTVARVDPETGKIKKTSNDASEYAWFVFSKLVRPEVHILDATPENERKRR